MSAPAALGELDAVELRELLEFVHDWIGSHRHHAAESLDLFTGGGYRVEELLSDLARFAFLLGGDADRYLHGTDQ